MWQDPIVEEVHRIRDEHARKFNYDLHAICEDFRAKQLLSAHKIVSRQPRRPVPPVIQQHAPAKSLATASLRQDGG